MGFINNIIKDTKRLGLTYLENPNHLYKKMYYSNYLSSTLAPASSIAFLRFSASSLATPSLIVEGAPSTRSLASFKPRPQASLTAFTTWSLARSEEHTSELQS